MKVELKRHSWGERAIITMDDGRDVEVMRFDEAGTDHSHPVCEIATCISGRGVVWYGGLPLDAKAGDVKHIHAGAMHHMEPDPECAEPFEWIIRYEA